MAVRSSMTDIIQAVADLIGDPSYSLVTQQQNGLNVLPMPPGADNSDLARRNAIADGKSLYLAFATRSGTDSKYIGFSEFGVTDRFAFGLSSFSNSIG